MTDPLDKYFLGIFLSISLSLWTCTDIKGSEKWDLSTMPSLLGPGTYLAWIVTGIDAFWDQWAEIMPWRGNDNDNDNQSPHSTDAHDDREVDEGHRSSVLQVIAFGAYAAVSLTYLGLEIVQKMPSIHYVAHTDAFYLIINAVFVVAYPHINMVFPSGVIYDETQSTVQWLSQIVMVSGFKLSFAAIIWSAPFNGLETFSLRVHRVWGFGLMTAEFLVLLTLRQLGICKWTLNIMWAYTIPSMSSLLIKRLLAKTEGDDESFPKWEGTFRLRVPMPRTSTKLSELDQAFTLGLAVASLLYSRRKTVGWVCKKALGELMEIIVRVQRLFTEREV